MATALDAPADMLDDGEKVFVENIREHGWFATHVYADDEHPSFTYTTGFQVTLGMPEVILFSIKQETAHNILWDVFRDWKTGGTARTGVPVSNLFGNAEAFLFPVANRNYREYLGWSLWFYGSDDFPCLHLIWPDPNGLFPWHPGFDERFRSNQPDLTETGWLATLAN